MNQTPDSWTRMGPKFQSPGALVRNTILAISLLFASSLLAQVPRYEEELTVTEVTLEFTVTDQAGNPVVGLTADDFEFVEDGTPVRATFFEEIRLEAVDVTDPSESARVSFAQARQEPRTAFIFIDNVDINRVARPRLFATLAASADEMMRSGVEIIFLLWSGGRLEMIRPEGRASLRSTIESIGENKALKAAGAGGDNFRELSLAFDEADMGLARSALTGKSFSLFSAVEAAARVASHARGRRIMILISRGFGIPTPEVSAAAASVAQASIGQGTGMGVGVEGVGNLFAPEILLPTVAGDRKDPSIQEALAAIGNHYGITFYSLFSGGLQAATPRATMSRNPVQADGTREQPRYQNQLGAELTSLNVLADITGGTSLGATSNFAPFFERVTTDLNHFYRAAYRSAVERKFKRIEIRPRRKGLEVRHRKSVLPSPPAG